MEEVEEFKYLGSYSSFILIHTVDRVRWQTTAFYRPGT